VAKRHGVSDTTIYIWRKKFDQLGTDEVKRLEALEQRACKAGQCQVGSRTRT